MFLFLRVSDFCLCASPTILYIFLIDVGSVARFCRKRSPVTTVNRALTGSEAHSSF